MQCQLEATGELGENDRNFIHSGIALKPQRLETSRADSDMMEIGDIIQEKVAQIRHIERERHGQSVASRSRQCEHLDGCKDIRFGLQNWFVDT